MIIAQISDIHAAADNDHLVRFARALTWLDNLQPDALVISGDLIDDQWFEGYHRITEQLNARLYPTYILPGNSDNPEQMGLILGERFRAGNRTASAGHFVAQVGNLRLIGLDTTIAATSAGAVGPHLHWLSENLTAEPGA